MAKRLRSGYTTGACAAAAAKAATMLLVKGIVLERVDIPFPDGSRHGFDVQECAKKKEEARAGVIKDAGDDPDVTNGAMIEAFVRYHEDNISLPEHYINLDDIILYDGEGVGRAGKPGLAVKVGEPAINPVPRKMIAEAVREIGVNRRQRLLVKISVPRGRELARKTMNKRLGIIGGLSILGTTGIVRPISAEAWTATITAAMKVARASGLDEVVLATGRTSERGAQSRLNLAEEAFVMMGDYLEFSLLEAAALGFYRIHLAGMWAKIVKAALKVPQTHVRNGALEMREAADLLAGLGAKDRLLAKIRAANTAREMLIYLQDYNSREIVLAVCEMARDYGREVSGLDVQVYLVNHQSKVLAHV